jgi:hypothetical protein
MLVELPNGHSADVVADALARHITALPQQLRRSLTWDQGKEMAAHARFSVATGVPVYFCDPRSPWQRGSNENTNGLLRQYLPKRSDLAPFSQHDLDAVAAELNGRPRQTLGWMTPSEALDQACDDPLRPQPFRGRVKHDLAIKDPGRGWVFDRPLWRDPLFVIGIGVGLISVVSVILLRDEYGTGAFVFALLTSLPAGVFASGVVIGTPREDMRGRRQRTP